MVRMYGLRTHIGSLMRKPLNIIFVLNLQASVLTPSRLSYICVNVIALDL